MARVLLLAAATLAAGCDNVDRLIVGLDERITVPGEAAGETVLEELPPFDELAGVDLSRSPAFRQEGYDPADVVQVRLEALALRAREPADQDLSFFGTVVFYVAAADLPRVELARRHGFPEGDPEVALDTSAVDLTDYVMAREGAITAELKGSRRPPQDTEIEIELRFRVDVDVL